VDIGIAIAPYFPKIGTDQVAFERRQMRQMPHPLVTASPQFPLQSGMNDRQGPQKGPGRNRVQGPLLKRFLKWERLDGLMGGLGGLLQALGQCHVGSFYIFC
jgi:hypothetical protein